jgi:hypothetical protein
MATQSKYLFAFVLSFGGFIVLCPAADARTLGGFNGLPIQPTSANYACFHETYGGVYNASCSSNVEWEMTLPVDNAGYYTPIFGLEVGYGGTGMSCSACGMSADGQTSWCVASAFINAGTGNTSIGIANVYVPADGYMFAACSISGGSVWYSVRY